MGVYCMDGWDDQFLDCYLRLAAQLPADHPPGIRSWTLYALRCAQRCGRAEEVVDALHHVIQFHQNLPCAEQIRALLEQWEAQNRTGLEVNNR